jgi:hypothetical protein
MLESDRDRYGQPAVVSLNLVREKGDDNLLYQGRNLHGLQPFDFSARDLANGIDRSAYGRSRRLTLPESVGVLSIIIEDAVVDKRTVAPFIKVLDVTLSVSAGHKNCEISKLR